MKANTWMGVTMALALGGCAVDTSEPTGDVEEGLAEYTQNAFASWDNKRIEPPGTFPVAEGGAISVTMEPKWKPADSSYHCRVPAIYIALTKRTPKFDQIGQKTFATKGGPSTASWEGLHAGTYTLDLLTANENPGCLLTGKIVTKVGP